MCALATALEQQGHYRDALAAVAMYEAPESTAKLLDDKTIIPLRVQIGLGYNYTGDHPKAIAMLKSTVRDYSESGAASLGPIYAALSRIYRTISEYPIARDYAQRALENFRQTGDWRGSPNHTLKVAVADIQEGNYESGLENLAQAQKLIAIARLRTCLVALTRTWLELVGSSNGHRKASIISKGNAYYERTDHKTNAADGYNNLGINLILIGQWDRAQEALERALSLATEVDERGDKVPMILDSLANSICCVETLTKPKPICDAP